MDQTLKAVDLLNLNNLAQQAIPLLLQYGFQIILALFLLALGWYLGGKLGVVVTAFCERKRMDVTLSRFLGGVVRTLILFFAVLVALSKLQIEITPLVAALTASAFGLTLAIQGPIANYGAGLAIILTRPFAVGNTLSIKGVSGVVDLISLPCTKLKTEDGETITIPNKQIVGEIVINSFGLKVVETNVGLSYEDDPDRAIAILYEVLKQESEVSTDQPAQVGIELFGESSMVLGLRYWVPTKKYHGTRYRINLAIHHAFKKADLKMPYPQRKIHLIKEQLTS